MEIKEWIEKYTSAGDEAAAAASELRRIISGIVKDEVPRLEKDQAERTTTGSTRHKHFS